MCEDKKACKRVEKWRKEWKKSSLRAWGLSLCVKDKRHEEKSERKEEVEGDFMVWKLSELEMLRGWVWTRGNLGFLGFKDWNFLTFF